LIFAILGEGMPKYVKIADRLPRHLAVNAKRRIVGFAFPKRPLPALQGK
jgi:hypothetical protein